MAPGIEPAANEFTELPDYAWEKIIRAVMRGERLSYSAAVEWLLERHPEYDADDVAKIKHCAATMETYDASRAAAPPGTLWR